MTSENQTLVEAKMIACLEACARAGMQTGPMFALNKHMLGDRSSAGVGLEAIAAQLLAAGFDPPTDPQHFSAALACNMLGVFQTPAKIVVATSEL